MSNNLPALKTADLVAEFLAAKEQAGLAPKSLEQYRWQLLPFAEAHEVLPLDSSVVQAFLGRHSHQSYDTRKDAFRSVQIFYNWLVEKRQVLEYRDNPVLRVERPAGKSPVPRILSLAQLRDLVAVSKAPYVRAQVLTLLDTMCRIGELVGRRKEHISGNTLELWGKTGGRLVPLSPDVRAYLLALPTENLFPRITANGGLLVDEPASWEGLRVRIPKLMRRSGLKGRKLGAHTLRHSAATAYIDAGGDLKSLSLILGHTTTAMAEKYVHLAMSALQEKHAKHGVVGSLRGMGAAQLPEALPTVVLPPEVAEVPLEVAGRLVVLFLVQDRRLNHSYYYIRARLEGPALDGKRPPWHVCSLSPELPLNEVDAVRQALLAENGRRREMFDADPSKILVDSADVMLAIANDPSPEIIDRYAGEPVTQEDVDLFRRFARWLAET